MAYDYPLIHFKPIRYPDGGGGSIKVPDRSNPNNLFADAISQADGLTTISVPIDQEIEIGDYIRINHDSFSRS